MATMNDNGESSESGEQVAPVYPAHWEADVVLRDGRTCRMRPVRPADRDALAEFYESLSEETRYTRFFTGSVELASRDMERLLVADHREHVALLAFSGGEVIGVATFDAVGRAEAEIAFIVADSQQGRGLGSVLLEHLAAVAREAGFHRFKAEILPGNKRMLATFEAAGYTPSQFVEDGIVKMDFDIDPTHRSRSVARKREHRAESLSIKRLLEPKSVVVVASDVGEGSVGASLVANVVNAGFNGRIVAVSPGGESVGSVQGAHRLSEVAFQIDLVVMAWMRLRSKRISTHALRRAFGESCSVPAGSFGTTTTRANRGLLPQSASEECDLSAPMRSA